MTTTARRVACPVDADDGIAPTVEGQIVTLLRELRDEVRGLRADLARPRRRPRVALLAVIATAVQGRVFSAADVFKHARVDAALAAALAAGGVTNPRMLGHYLRRVERYGAGHVQVRRVGDDCDGLIWQCEFRT